MSRKLIKIAARVAITAAAVMLASCEKNKTSHEKVEPDEMLLTDLASASRKSVFMLEAYDDELKLMRKGTGFLANGKGLIVTNFHVIEDASVVIAKGSDGTKFEALGVIALSPTGSDLAGIQITADDVPELPMNREGIEVNKVGENIAVIGSPLGLEGTVSQGIISAIRVQSDEFAEQDSYIQITAPISPGSSGSPVLNMTGKVIGVVALGSDGENQNLNFAIPIDKSISMRHFNQVIPFTEVKIRLHELQAIHSGISNYYNLAILRGEQKDDIVKKSRIFSNKFSENKLVHNLIATNLLNLKYLDEALVYSKKSIDLDHDYADGWVTVGDIYNELKKTNLAIKSYNMANQIEENATVWYKIGLCHYFANSKHESMIAFERSVSKNPKHAPSWQKISAIHIIDNNLEKAVEAAKQATLAEPRSAEFWISYGDILKLVDEKDGALAAFERAVHLEPENREAWSSLGDFLNSFLQRPREAVEAYEKVTELDPENPDSWYDLAQVLEDYDNSESLKYFKKYIDIVKDRDDPNHLSKEVLAWSSIGEIYEVENQLDDAVKSYEKAIAELPDRFENYRVVFYISAASPHLRRGEVNKAFRYFQKGMNFENVNFQEQKRQWDKLLWLNDKQFNKSKAPIIAPAVQIDFLKKLESAGIQNEYLYYCLGVSYILLNDYNNSKKSLDLAIRQIQLREHLDFWLPPSTIYTSLSFSLLQLGNIDEAIVCAEEAASLQLKEHGKIITSINKEEDIDKMKSPLIRHFIEKIENMSNEHDIQKVKRYKSLIENM